MKRRIFGLLLCAVMSLQGAAVLAENNDVSVTVDNRTIYFEDQAPVISGERVLVPLRGVIEAMGASVRWDAEKRQAVVTSRDNRTLLVLNIDSTDFRKVTYVTITDLRTEELTTDVAPVIMNDRTMIPLRVISENLGADIVWDDKEYNVDIKTKEFKAAYAAEASDGQPAGEAFDEKTVRISLSADETKVKRGDTVKLRVSLSNFEATEGAAYLGGSLTVYYDSDSFAYAGYTAFINGEQAQVYAGADNPSFKDDSVKIAYIMNPNEQCTTEDGVIVELSFIADSDKGGSFMLSDRITNIGNDVSLTFSKDGKNMNLSRGEELIIDTAPVKIDVEPAESNR